MSFTAPSKLYRYGTELKTDQKNCQAVCGVCITVRSKKKLAALKLLKSSTLYCNYFGRLIFQTFKNFGQFYFQTHLNPRLKSCASSARMVNNYLSFLNAKHSSYCINFIISYLSLQVIRLFDDSGSRRYQTVY